MFERSWLDRFVRRFQDRWETNAQYRAAVTGVVGLGMVLLLCVCMLLVATTANSALASFGLTSSNNNADVNSNTGTNKVQQAASFPTATFAPFQTPAIPPVGTIASSQSPQPNATPTDTPNDATPTDTPGGGNNAPFICSGGGSGVTWTFNPCPLMVGQSGTLTIRAPGYPNTYTNILVNFGYCPNGDCTVDDPPTGPYHTNSAGKEVISFTVASDVQVGGPPVNGMIQFAGGPTVSINTQGSCQ